jgi:phage FluMu protein gp41
MATIKVTLKDGLKIGEETHLEAELREANAGDMLDATEESERAVLTPEGYKLLISPTQVGAQTLCRQIVKIGSHPGPLTMAELKKLSGRDLNTLQNKAMQLESADSEGLDKLGNG